MQQADLCNVNDMSNNILIPKRWLTHFIYTLNV